MRHWMLAGAIAFGMTIAGCTSSSSSSSDSGAEALQVDGVWVFRYDPHQVGLDALHTGEAAIVDSCLQTVNFICPGA